MSSSIYVKSPSHLTTNTTGMNARRNRYMAERNDYRHFVSIPTRWRDNDLYGHVNNIEYYRYFDTASIFT
jgi:acyl-ACP thioesterase